MGNFFNIIGDKFYIDRSYAISFIPLIAQAFSGKDLNTADEKTLVDTRTINTGSQVVEGKTVAVISFKQPVVKYSTYSWLGTQSYIRVLDNFKKDDSIAGVVLDVDSGGGQAYGTPEFYDYINSFKEVKPIGIYSGGLLCSGAYYFAAPASFILVNHRAEAVGSIGTYTVVSDFNGLWEKLGAKIHTIYASGSEDKNKAYRDVISGADADYSQYIKTELDPFNDSFISDMKAARPGIKEECFKGGTWNGVQAVEMGLADSVGTLHDAISLIYQLSNSNSNSNMSKKTKSFPAIQNVAGIEEDGIPIVTNIVGKPTGVQLEEAQLDKIEESLVQSEQAVKDAQAAQAAADNKLAAANKAANDAQTTAASLENSITVAVKAAGLEPAATAAENISLLSGRIIELGNAPGGQVTKPKAASDSADDLNDDPETSTSLYDSMKS